VTAPPTVLVVEDNALNLKLIRDVLEHAGFTVLVATSGEEGVDVATRGGLDLVLMDLQLPGIDGTEAMRRIRAHPGSRELPVVAVTAFAMAADREQVSSAGFDGYIEKPISTRALPELVRRHVGAADG
jgi:two-component system, cell cycle response regulator DivK